MIHRPKTGAFPNVHAFLGGKVDQADEDFEPFSNGLTDVQASTYLNLPHGGLSYWVAAIRECFEESNVLLAQHQKGTPLTDLDSELTERFVRLRQELSLSPNKFREFLEAEQLMLSTSHVHYFSHWITPEGAPRRFNTRFFIALLPEGQQAIAHETEVVSGCWIRPKDALANFTNKEWHMILPTLITLRMIDGHANASALYRYVSKGYHRIPVRPAKQLQGMQPYPELE